MTQQMTEPQATTTQATGISNDLFRQLQQARFETENLGRKEGYLAVMLVRRANWTAEQTAEFLNCSATDVHEWLERFGKGNIDALRGAQPVISHRINT